MLAARPVCRSLAAPGMTPSYKAVRNMPLVMSADEFTSLFSATFTEFQIAAFA